MSPARIIIIIGILFLLLTWLAFLDIARKDFGSTAMKFMWGCIAFIPFIGVLVYFIFGYRKGKIKTADITVESTGKST